MGFSHFSIDTKNVLIKAAKNKKKTFAGFSTCAPSTKCAHLPKRKIEKTVGVCLVVTTKSLSHEDRSVATMKEIELLDANKK